jgi:methyl-accepting chemotaxis protein
MSTYKTTRFLTRLLLMLTVVSVGMVRAVAAPSQSDSEEINKLLADAKAEAVELKHDAREMESFTRSGVNWESHAQKLTLIKEHVNKCGEVVQKLNDAKSTGSPWQQTAIERVTPLLSEMAKNIEGTIEHLNNNKSRVRMQPFKDYVVANYDLANQLAALINDFVDYGKSKDKFENLGDKLEVAER